MTLSPDLVRWICDATGARDARRDAHIQSLWSGYGELFRVALDGADAPSAIVKLVRPQDGRHPRGWNGDRGHARKLRSYDVELAWYTDWSPRCGPASRVPARLAAEADDAGWRFLLEDLDAAGYAVRTYDPDDTQLAACLDWLAHFHATFLGATPDGLWPTGTYWHLETRPDELRAMPDGPLRRAAEALDAALSGARHTTLVHGDAKVANFCFPTHVDTHPDVAAVDFQYVGGGCGMKDLAYFLGSCLGERALARRAPALVDDYFARLRVHLATLQPHTDPDALEAEWRALYPLAWADFTRFLQGWSPGHRKLHGYSAEMTRQALASLV